MKEGKIFYMNIIVCSSVKKRNRDVISLLIYIALFFLAQSIYTYFYTHTALRSNYLLQAVIRFSIWTVPVFIYLILSKKNPFEYLKLNRNILKGILWGLIIGSLIILYNVISVYLLYGHVNSRFYISGNTWLHDTFTIISTAFQPFYVLLMFSEEILFRGFFLQKVQEVSTFWIGNIANAILFALIHIIGWTIQGQSIINYGFGVFVFALIAGIVLKKTNSIWSCVLIHIFNNFIGTSMIL